MALRRPAPLHRCRLQPGKRCRLVRPRVQPRRPPCHDFMPNATQRLWRTVTRREYQLTRNRVELQNRLEALLEEAHLNSIFELLYRRFVGRLGHGQAIGVIPRRLCRLVWKILHEGVTYEQRGPVVSKARAQRRAAKMLRELRSLGYHVTSTSSGNALYPHLGFRPCLEVQTEPQPDDPRGENLGGGQVRVSERRVLCHDGRRVGDVEDVDLGRDRARAQPE